MVYASEHSVTVCLDLIPYGCPRVIRRPDKKDGVINVNRYPFNNSMALEVAWIASKRTSAHYIEEEIDHETNDYSIIRHYSGTDIVCE